MDWSCGLVSLICSCCTFFKPTLTHYSQSQFPPGCRIRHVSLFTPLPPYSVMSITISSTGFQPCFKYSPRPFGEASMKVFALCLSAMARPSSTSRVPRPWRWCVGATQRRYSTWCNGFSVYSSCTPVAPELVVSWWQTYRSPCYRPYVSYARRW